MDVFRALVLIVVFFSAIDATESGSLASAIFLFIIAAAIAAWLWHDHERRKLWRRTRLVQIELH